MELSEGKSEKNPDASVPDQLEASNIEFLKQEECVDIYFNLVEEAPLGIYIVQDGDIIFGNKWLRDFSGYSLDDLPMSVLEVIVPKERPFVAEQMTKRVTGKDALDHYTVGFLKRNGTAVKVELIAKLITCQGKVAIQESIVDLSEKVAAEEKLKDYTALLEQANRLKKFCVEVISHDILNRIWVAESCAKEISSSGLSEEQEVYLTTVMAALQSARNTLRNISKFIELMDKPELKFKKLKINCLIDDLIVEFGIQLKVKGIKISFNPKKDYIIDGSLILKEVFSNLIMNSIKYSPDNSTILIEIEEGEFLQIRFEDQGPGVPDHCRDKIFRKFERLKSHHVKGSGLGLALVKETIDRHGGRVWMENKPAGGSIFIVELPKTQSS